MKQKAKCGDKHFKGNIYAFLERNKSLTGCFECSKIHFQKYKPLHNFVHMTIFKLMGTRRPQDLLLGKVSFCSTSLSERYCQSFICPEHTFDPGLKAFSLFQGLL